MDHSVSSSASARVLHRFGLRLGLLLLITGLQAMLGYQTAFFDLVPLFAGVCTTLAIISHEWPLARTLNHWDEACGFGLLVCLG